MTSSPRDVKSPRAVAVAFTKRNTRLTVELEDGRVISAPLAWYPRLQHGRPSERRSWRLIGEGLGIHWPDLDEDIRIEHLLSGVRSGESARSLERWLESRPARKKAH